MCQVVWERSGDATVGASLRRWKLGRENYDKNSYNCMRTYLAAQVCSLPQVQCMDEFAKNCGGEEKYSSLQMVLLAVGQLDARIPLQRWRMRRVAQGAV